MGPLCPAARVVAIGLAVISASAWPAAASAAPVESAQARSAFPDERREDAGAAHRRAVAQERAYSSYGQPAPVARGVVPSTPVSSSGGRPSYVAVVVALLTLIALAGLNLRPQRPKRASRATRQPPLADASPRA
jgi:hypothetical protein